MSAASKIVQFHTPDDDELNAAIGRVSILHSRLDYVLRLTIKTLSGLELQKAMDATQKDTSMELRRRVRRWGRRRLGESEALITLQAYVQRCKRVSNERNRLMHAIYAKPIDGDPLILDRDRREQRFPTVEEIKVIEHELETLCAEMNGARFDDGYLAKALGDDKGPH